MFYVCYEVAPEEVANHCVLEGRATQLHPNTPVLLEDAASDEEKKKKQSLLSCIQILLFSSFAFERPDVLFPQCNIL